MNWWYSIAFRKNIWEYRSKKTANQAFVVIRERVVLFVECNFKHTCIELEFHKYLLRQIASKSKNKFGTDANGTTMGDTPAFLSNRDPSSSYVIIISGSHFYS